MKLGIASSIASIVMLVEAATNILAHFSMFQGVLPLGGSHLSQFGLIAIMGVLIPELIEFGRSRLGRPRRHD
jgi:hypothetical protein